MAASQWRQKTFTAKACRKRTSNYFALLHAIFMMEWKREVLYPMAGLESCGHYSHAFETCHQEKGFFFRGIPRFFLGLVHHLSKDYCMKLKLYLYCMLCCYSGGRSEGCGCAFTSALDLDKSGNATKGRGRMEGGGVKKGERKGRGRREAALKLGSHTPHSQHYTTTPTAISSTLTFRSVRSHYSASSLLGDRAGQGRAGERLGCCWPAVLGWEGRPGEALFSAYFL